MGQKGFPAVGSLFPDRFLGGLSHDTAQGDRGKLGDSWRYLYMSLCRGIGHPQFFG